MEVKNRTSELFRAAPNTMQLVAKAMARLQLEPGLADRPFLGADGVLAM